MSELISKNESWKMFNTISPTYDKINKVISLYQDQKWRKKVACHLPKQDRLEILDLASGTGDQIIALLESQCNIEKIIGLDLAEDMLKNAKEKISKKPFQNKVQYCVADAQELPFKSNKFDAVTFSFGIRNVPDPLKALHEIYRVLKPNGKCLILEFSIPPYPFKSLFLFYLRHIMPKIGKILSTESSAYTYLNKTIETFPSGDKFIHLLKSAQFSKLSIHPMMLGAVSLYVGTKK